MHRVRGGLVAGTLFVLPGLLTLGFLSWLYAAFGQIGIVSAIFFGLKAAVLAIVLEAVVRVGKRALRRRAMVLIAAAAFVAIFAFAVPFPLVILAAALIGLAGHRLAPDVFQLSAGHGSPASASGEALLDQQFARGVPDHIRPSGWRFVKTLLIGLSVWFGPVVMLAALFGPQAVFTTIATFNSKMAVVTFGGAYAVLAYMAQQAVEHYHWLKPGEMLVGLGFAETTPGPLISVVQFVGFVAAFRQAGSLDPVLAGTLGGLIAMWCTFVPSFLWIFLGGPYVEALIGNERLKAALSAVTAAVVGVILNLAIWFALHVLFADVMQTRWGLLSLPIPALHTIQWPALVIAAAAMIATFGFKTRMISLLAACCAAGVGWHLMSGMM
jgi:chromate transporter